MKKKTGNSSLKRLKHALKMVEYIISEYGYYHLSVFESIYQMLINQWNICKFTFMWCMLFAIIDRVVYICENL